MATITPTDIHVSNQHIDVSSTLTTPIFLSLLSWARARDGDNVPAGAEQHGWWGDAYADTPGDEFGSRLWTLLGRPVSSVLDSARLLSLEALQWLLDDGLVTALDVEAIDVGENTIALDITGVPSDSSLDTHLATVRLVLS